MPNSELLCLLLRCRAPGDGCNQDNVDCERNHSGHAIKPLLLTVTICRHYSAYDTVYTTKIRIRACATPCRCTQGKPHDDYGRVRFARASHVRNHTAGSPMDSPGERAASGAGGHGQYAFRQWHIPV